MRNIFIYFQLGVSYSLAIITLIVMVVTWFTPFIIVPLLMSAFCIKCAHEMFADHKRLKELELNATKEGNFS